MRSPSFPSSYRRSFLSALALTLISSVALTGCDEDSSKTTATATPRTEVSVVTLHPQSVTITAALPGRTTASLVAEVRPQVGGIIQERLFQEGSEVKKGQVLYIIDPAPYQASYDSAVASLDQAKAAVPSAETKVVRYKKLIKQSVISQQDLDDAIATLAQDRAAVALAKADVETARINLNYTKITAPISGRIDKSSLTPGALVTASQDTALTTIRKLDPINVDVTQSATNLLNLRQAISDGRVRLSGNDVEVKLILDNGNTYDHTGTLEFAEANVSETTGTYSLRAQFPNPDRLLLPGMYVRAVVEEGVSPNSFLVPQRAVSRNTKGEAVVLIVNKDNKVEKHVLDVLRNVGNSWLVDSGVKDGDRVVVEGSQRVSVDQVVNATEVTLDEATGDVQTSGNSSSKPADASSSVKKD